MDRFEDDLRESLSRVEPAEGFADRVLARLEASQQRGSFWRNFLESFTLAPRMAYVAVAMAVLMTAGVVQHERREREKGLEARDQLRIALRIAGGKLHYARERVTASAGERE